MKTLTRTIKTAKKSTSSHASKVASKSKKVSTAKVKPYLEKARYEKETIKDVYAVGQGMIKFYQGVDKKEAISIASLTLLSVDLINQGLKSNISLNKDTLREVLYEFTGYKGSMNIPSFAMAIKRVNEKAILITDPKYKNLGLNLNEKTNQVVDKKGNVFSVKKIDEAMKEKGVNTRKRNSNKNSVNTLSELEQGITAIFNNAKFLEHVANEKLAKLSLLITTAMAKQSIEVAEEPNTMKKIGEMKLPKNAFGKSQLNQAVSNQ